VLSPHSRMGLFEALRPPPGSVVDAAVGTSFTLDLEALLTAPIAFALFEANDTDRDEHGLEPVGLLEAIRRHSQHVIVFSQAGQIAVPDHHRTVFAWIEDAVHEVTTPRPGYLFHPKVWVVRYRHSESSMSLRVLCATRNLTFDTSWDTLLRLDSEVIKIDAPQIGTNRALADFVMTLPGMASRPVLAGQQAMIDGLAADLGRVEFGAPDPFTSVDLKVLGLNPVPDMFPSERCRAVVISPFVSDAFLERFSERFDVKALISREETLDRLETSVIAGAGRLAVLHPAADLGRDKPTTGTDAQIPGQSDTEKVDAVPLFGGLHAKLFAFENTHESLIVTGSANATEAAFDGNVEIVAALIGPPGAAIDALLAETKGETGFVDLLLDYEPLPVPLPPEESEHVQHRLERIRRELAAGTYVANVTDEGDAYRLEVSGDHPIPVPRRDETLVVDLWPSTLIEDQSAIVQLAGTLPSASYVVSFEGVTAFFALRVTLQIGDIVLSTTSLVVARLEGAPADRHSRLLASMLRDGDRLMRYLLLLLSDVDPTGDDGELGNGKAWLRRWSGNGWDDVPLLELLVRAVDQFPKRLDHIDGLLRDLTEHRDEVLPVGFDDVWLPIWGCRVGAVDK
jgi:hypothetical protein